MRVLITGATGFVGGYLSNFLEERGYSVFRGVRKASKPNDREYGDLKNLSKKTDWEKFFKDIDVIVHCAARVHVMNDLSEDPLAEFRKFNVEATEILGNRAKEFGVKKFIFLSSIKVNGEGTDSGNPFKESDAPSPQDSYGVSKLEAEQVLRKISDSGDMRVTVFRPPLIYGPGVKGNIKRLVRLMKRFPMIPLGGINNKRSMISLRNLSSVIEKAIIEARNERFGLFLISDNSDISTSNLIRLLAKSIDKKVLLIPIPVRFLSLIFKLLGKANFNQRLFGSLTVDTTLVRRELDWSPNEDMVDLFKEVTD
ncbi:MAG: NAD-dependent epimerase/dehydratase family protein [Halobacteriovoraceae bacterium]|nr:NAD-dependent epimerase/dehydratase family protein [Halobacteriovoraceae bacterium]